MTMTPITRDEFTTLRQALRDAANFNRAIDPRSERAKRMEALYDKLRETDGFMLQEVPCVAHQSSINGLWDCDCPECLRLQRQAP